MGTYVEDARKALDRRLQGVNQEVRNQIYNRISHPMEFRNVLMGRHNLHSTIAEERVFGDPQVPDQIADYVIANLPRNLQSAIRTPADQTGAQLKPFAILGLIAIAIILLLLMIR